MSDEPQRPDPRFLFVAPMDPGGPLDAYAASRGTGARVSVPSSCDWLYERAVRRGAVLRAAGRADAAGFLAEREGAYRLVRLAMAAHAGVREAYLRYDPLGGFATDPHEVAVRRLSEVPALVSSVLRAPDGLVDPGVWWMDPDAWPSESSMDALESETTSFSGSWDVDEGPSLRGTTAVVRVPYGLSGLPLFRLLADVRCDDPLEERAVPVWDRGRGEFVDRRALLPRACVHATPDADPAHGEFRTWDAGPHGSFEVLDFAVPHGLSRRMASATSLWALHGRVDMDFSAYSGEGSAFSRGDKTPAGGRDTVGMLDAPPRAARGGAGVVSTGYGPDGESSAYWFRACPSPSWGDADAPTFWEASGFPGWASLPSPASAPVRRQLEALSVTQPSVPGFPVHLFSDGGGGLGYLPLRDDTEETALDGALLDPLLLAGWGAAFPVPNPAALPALSATLDRMTCTLVRVPALFAFLESSCERVERYLSTYDGEARFDQEDVDSRDESGSVAGTPSSVLWGRVPLPDRASESGAYDGTGDVEYSQRDERTYEVWSSASLTGLLALRSGHSCPSGTRVDESSESVDYMTGGRTRTESSRGARVMDGPADSDLLFPADVLPWISRAELFLVADVVCEANGGYEGESGSEVTEDGDAGTVYGSEWDSVEGGRPHCARLSVVSLGEMDPDTGEFPPVDPAGLALRLLPAASAEAPVEVSSHLSIPALMDIVETVDKSHAGATRTTRTDREYSFPLRFHAYVRRCALYAAVEWDFDTEEPHPSSGDAGFSPRLRVARGRLSAARALAAAALSALDGASRRIAECAAAADVLDGVLDGLDAGSSAARDAEVDRRRDGLSRAEEALLAADAAAAEAAARTDALQAEADALAASAAAKEAAGEDPSGDYEALSSKLAELASSRLARSGADDAAALAREAVDRARASLDEATAGAAGARQAADDAMAALEAALSDAGAALSAAEAAAERAGGLCSAADAALADVGRPPAEAGVAAAEAACAAALSAADALWGDSQAAGPFAALEDAVAAASAALRAAEAAVWAYARGA